MVRFVIVAFAVLAGIETSAFAAKPTPKQIEFFEKKIRPILVSRCYQCHSKDAKKVRGGLLLDSKAGWMTGGESGPTIAPGDPKESLLIQAVNFDGMEMPPKGKLPASEIALLTKWVKMGAPDPRINRGGPPILRKIDIAAGRKFWAFQPPRASAAPQVKDESWPRHDLDRFVLAKLAANGLVPVADAHPRTLIRRLYFDVIGLPPSPQVIARFVADPSPQAYAQIVDDLLRSPQFGERWARHWFDVARYAESTGKERNFTYPQAWRYRDYVIASLNADKPYDQFIREQIAGDLLTAKTVKRRNELTIATGFLALGPKSLNERNKRRFKMDIVDEQIDVTTRAVMGLTVSCARCHDHKFDPIPTKDYYALAGIFVSTNTLYGIRGGGGNRQPSTLIALQGAGGNAKKKQVAAKATPKKKATSAATGNVAAKRRELKQLRTRMRKLQQSRRKLTGTNKVRRKGKGKKKKKTKAKAERAKSAAVVRIDRQIGQLRRRIRQLNRQLKGKGKKNKKRRKRGNAIPKGPVAMGVRDGKAGDTRIHIRGDVQRLGTTVQRGFLQVAHFSRAPSVNRQQSGRLQLANWLVSRNNPLTARVAVNRIWLHLFGQGIVSTTDNFGATGDRPANQPLLDYLAVEFMRQGWSTKKMVRAIVLSRTYQLSSQQNEKNFAADPANRWNWRANHRRLDAESIRDAVLAASGKLNLAPRKRSVIAEIGSANIGRNQRTLKQLNAASPHRSVYLPIVRNLVPGMLRAFDFAEPSMVVGRRDVTTVPGQALYMMNNPFVLRQSRWMAQRLLDAKLASDDDRIRLAFQLAYARIPRSRELAVSKKFVADFRRDAKQSASAALPRHTGWAELCQALFASAEFQCVD